MVCVIPGKYMWVHIVLMILYQQGLYLSKFYGKERCVLLKPMYIQIYTSVYICLLLLTMQKI